LRPRASIDANPPSGRRLAPVSNPANFTGSIAHIAVHLEQGMVISYQCCRAATPLWGASAYANAPRSACGERAIDTKRKPGLG
jgi:hypothetical protein